MPRFPTSLTPSNSCRPSRTRRRLEAAAGVTAAGVAVVAGVEVAAELPPRALINWLKALLRFAIAFDDRFEPVVLVTI